MRKAVIRPLLMESYCQLKWERTSTKTTPTIKYSYRTLSSYHKHKSIRKSNQLQLFFGASLDLIFSTSLVPIWNAFVNTLSGTEDVKSVSAIDCVPGSWLLNPAITAAGYFWLLFWKWTRPLGKTKTSPFVIVLETRAFAVVMKPTSSVPAV